MYKFVQPPSQSGNRTAVPPKIKSFSSGILLPPESLGEYWLVHHHCLSVFGKCQISRMTHSRTCEIGFFHFAYCLGDSGNVLHTSVGYSFLLLRNISLYGCVTTGLSFHSLRDSWCFQFQVIFHRVDVNICLQVFERICVSLSYSKFIRVGLLVHLVNVGLTG